MLDDVRQVRHLIDAVAVRDHERDWRHFEHASLQLMGYMPGARMLKSSVRSATCSSEALFPVSGGF